MHVEGEQWLRAIAWLNDSNLRERNGRRGDARRFSRTPWETSKELLVRLWVLYLGHLPTRGKIARPAARRRSRSGDLAGPRSCRESPGLPSTMPLPHPD